MTDVANEYAADPQMKAVALGLEAAHFIEHTSLGKHLVDRAHQCRIQALEALAVINPYEISKVQDLQVQAKIPDLFLSWLDEAIANGAAAEENIALEELYETPGRPGA